MPAAKLTKDQIIELRTQCTPEDVARYADNFGVTTTTIVFAIEGKTYKQYNELAKPHKLERKVNKNSLPDEIRDAIKARANNGENLGDIANDYDMSRSYVSLIARDLR